MMSVQVPFNPNEKDLPPQKSTTPGLILKTQVLAESVKQ